MPSKQLRALVVVGMLALAGCGDDEGSSESAAPAAAATVATVATAPTAAAATQPAPARKPKGTVVTVGDSDFGPMLFDAKQQAIYIFENDPKGKSVCYDDCAAAWPPVLTKGEPRGTKGAKDALLGTVKRRDGKLQVTYAGKPLYFYANEAPGEVRCHNVDLNGGLWWVVGPDGKRRP